MKKVRLFFHEMIFLAVLRGLFSAGTKSRYAFMKSVPNSLVLHQVPAGSYRPNLRLDCLAAAGST